MNELEFFLSLEQHNRQTGRTTALAKACQDIGGIFVVSSEAVRKDLKSMFPGLKIETLGNQYALIGSNSPVILDHFAWKQILLNYELESKQLRADIQSYRRELLRIKKIINDLDLDI